MDGRGHCLLLFIVYGCGYFCSGSIFVFFLWLPLCIILVHFNLPKAVTAKGSELFDHIMEVVAIQMVV